MGFREMMARRKEGQDELDQELMDEQGEDYEIGDPAMTPPEPMGAGKPQERDEESILQDALPDSPEALAALTGGTGMDIPDFGTQEPGPEEPGMEEMGMGMGMDPNAGLMGMEPGMAGSGPAPMPGGVPAPQMPPPPPGPPGMPPGAPPAEDPLAAARRQMASRIAGGGV
jgi:hypothetical protein